MHFLVGFDAAVYRAFLDEGVEVPAWIQVARSREKMLVPTNTETIWWDDMVLSNVAKPFSADLDPDLARRVRDLSYPYFIRMQDRVYYQKILQRGSWLDAVNKLEMMIHYFHSLLTRHNIRYVISSNIPHEGPHIILYFLAREMGLVNVLATQSLFPDGYWVIPDFETYGHFKHGLKKPHAGYPIVENPETPFYMNRIPQLSRWKHHGYLTWTAAKIACKAPLAFLGLRRRSFNKSVFKYKERAGWFDLHNPQRNTLPIAGEKYVYFPMHLQPEMTTDTLGHEYCDQLLVIEELVRKLPDDVFVYLKENPKQTGRMREASFLERMNRIPRVRYLPIHINSLDLIRGSDAVATITGTAGWEALQIGKPVICFGSAWFRSLPGVFEWRDNPSYDAVMSYRFDADRLQASFNDLCGYLFDGVVDPDYRVLISVFDEADNARKVASGLLRYIESLERP